MVTLTTGEDPIASSIDNTPFCTEVRNVCETAMRSHNPGKDITELEDKFPCRNQSFLISQKVKIDSSHSFQDEITVSTLVMHVVFSDIIK